MKKLLPIILSLGLCGAAAFAADPPADKKAPKKDDTPAAGKAPKKVSSSADKGAAKKDDAPAETRVGKTEKSAKAPEKNSK